MAADPIDNVQWVHARKLWANGWNPNVVFNQELTLLENSILDTGWIQPVLITPDFMIIDGFHRVQLTLTSQKLRDRYAEELPCVILDIPTPQAMMMTVRINRAKGQHVAFKMSELVQTLVEEYEVTAEEMMEGMGMTKSEVLLLLDGSLLKHRDLQNWKYSKAWVPVETTHMTEEERKAL